MEGAEGEAGRGTEDVRVVESWTFPVRVLVEKGEGRETYLARSSALRLRSFR